MKYLVVYFSNSGRTRCVAEAIAHELSADVDEILERKPRFPLLDEEGKPAGGFAMPRAALAGFLGAGSAIKQCSVEPSDYDVVLIGTPVWVGSVVPAVRSYIKQHRKPLKTAAFFCTAGEPEKQRAFTQMGKLARCEPVATLAVHSDDVKANEYGGAVHSFVERVRGK
ncbi:MAG: flavodoxin [Dehalococcoidia bacterium]|nr:flavodoxin [Dehalococcoidia bacterium]